MVRPRPTSIRDSLGLHFKEFRWPRSIYGKVTGIARSSSRSRGPQHYHSGSHSCTASQVISSSSFNSFSAAARDIDAVVHDATMTSAIASELMQPLGATTDASVDYVAIPGIPALMDQAVDIFRPTLVSWDSIEKELWDQDDQTNDASTRSKQLEI